LHGSNLELAMSERVRHVGSPHFSHVRLSTDRVENSDRENFALGNIPQGCRLSLQLLPKWAPRKISLGATFDHNAPQQRPGLLDHLVGEREQLVRHFKAERLRGLEVDHQFELRRL
jgi:hypothetical protein